MSNECSIDYRLKIIFIILIALIIILIIYNFIDQKGFGCKIIDKFNGEDKYCSFEYRPSISNVSRSSFIDKHWVIRSHKQDLINKEIRENEYKKRMEEESKRIKCFNEGSDFNFSYDLFNYYSLNCDKLNYLNNHLIDEIHSGGNMKSVYSGFFSSMKTEVNLLIVKRSIAAGKLIKNEKYHLDCNLVKSNEVIEYYGDKDFVMYYVERCLK